MINSRVVKRVIDGVNFTFECKRSVFVGFDNVKHFNKTWIWGADCLTGRHVAKGSKLSIYNGIKHQVKAAKMQLTIKES